MILNLIFSTVGDIFAKEWGLTGDRSWLWFGMGINVLTIFFFMASIRYGNLSTTSAILLILTIIINAGVGFLFFHEHIVISQWIGIALGLVAAMLILGIYKVS